MLQTSKQSAKIAKKNMPTMWFSSLANFLVLTIACSVVKVTGS